MSCHWGPTISLTAAPLVPHEAFDILTLMAMQVATDPVGADLDQVEALLGDVVSSRLGGEGRVSVLWRKDTCYPYSCVRRVRFERSERQIDVFLKRIRYIRGPSEPVMSRLKNEGDLLLQLNQSMPSRVASFVGLYLDQLTLVTEACRGNQFDHLLAGSLLRLLWPKKLARLVEASRRCGEWLNQFHRLTHDPGADLSDWLGYQSGEAEWRIRKLIDLDPGNSNLYRECGKRFEDDLTAFRLSGVGCTIHGDYAPHNIFVDDSGQVQVLDFFAARKAHPLADVVNYLGKIASYAESPLFRPWAARKLCEGFLSGYRNLDKSEHKLFRVLLVLQTIKRMLWLRSRRRNARMLVSADRCRGWYVPYLMAYVSTGSEETEMTWPWPFLNSLVGPE